MYQSGWQHSPLPTSSSISWRRKASRTVSGLATLAILFLLTAYRSPLSSQSTPASPQAPTAEFQRLGDSLARSSASDATALRTLLRSSVRYHKSQPTDHSAALRSGLVALRLGELRADPDFSEALSIFREAARRGSDPPEA